MPLPSSPNPISLSQIGTEFDDTAPHAMSEFHGVGVPPVASSGPLSFSDFHGLSNYADNQWTIQSSSQVNNISTNNNGVTQYINQTLNFGSTTGWSAGDLLIVCTFFHNSSSNTHFQTPVGWTLGDRTTSGSNQANTAIYGRIISASDAAATSYSVSFQTNSQYNLYDLDFGAAWWRLRKTSGVTGHTTLVREAGSDRILTNAGTLSIPTNRVFPAGASPILAGVVNHESSSSAWSSLSSYQGMNSNAKGYSPTNQIEGWQASIQTWSNASLPDSSVNGNLTGNSMCWAWFYTEP